ncbi:hypothetical protein ACFFQW_46155 [Umezawaea endophytica]|uniref:Uncharacterized protein n=1 Tax=Umezawaea endophytica TaxID=1654476 RepID=A0A9X2VYX8_9PSEU|nr:hypothetical protein [Umezawaea endophytica]MCS7484584.1 hypothetical protein [Umezawaea endophytica]
MAHIADRPPVRLMVPARLVNSLNWASNHGAQWGSIAAAAWIVIVRAVGEPWWAAALCGVLFGVVAVLCPPSASRIDDDR